MPQTAPLYGSALGSLGAGPPLSRLRRTLPLSLAALLPHAIRRICDARAGFRGLAAIALSLALLLPAASAQSDATGRIAGQVRNLVSGQFLNNAPVNIVGTDILAFTNEFGEFMIDDIPAGEVTLRVDYTGLEPKEVRVTVQAGTTVREDVALTSARISRDMTEDGTIVLDAFLVASQRETNAANIASNEQRYAPNIKNVVAADAFGDVTEGNVGEFIKYLPGITVDYVAADVRTISVRGFADNFTSVAVDGNRLASSVSGNTARTFELEQVSINNVSRIEVTKVPRPQDPADSLGGSINMVSKSAFEREGWQLKYRAYLSVNSEALDFFRRTPGPGQRETFKALPGADFDLTLPLTKKFGIVLTALTSNQFNEQHRGQMVWNHAQAGATAANPYMQQVQIQDGPKNTFRDSVSLRADWRFAEGHLLTASVQGNYYKSFFGNRNLNFNAGTNPAGSGYGATPLAYGPDFTQAASGRGQVTQDGSFRNKMGATIAGNITWRYSGAHWEAEAGAAYSKSKTWYRDTSHAHFSGIATTLQGVRNLRMEGLDEPIPDTFIVTNSSGAPIDYNDLANYRVTRARSTPVDGYTVLDSYYGTLKRKFDIGIPAAVMVGASLRAELKDNRRYQNDYTFLGADGVANTADDSALQFRDPLYSREDPGFGLPGRDWASPYLVFDRFKSNPGQFALTPASETFRITNSQKIREDVTAAFGQLELNAFNNRLRFVGGARFELTENEGFGPLVDPDAVWQRNPDGTFVDGSTAAGLQRVRKPEAGAVGSFEEIALTRKERGFFASRDYDGTYPSAHLTYNITNDLLLRFAYAKTIGRPDYAEIVPTATFDEADSTPGPGQPPGIIDLTNPGLKPWEADNWDLSAEYYLPQGGVLSAGVFQKDITDFFGTTSTILTPELAAELGIDEQYIGWTVETTINSGDAKIRGVEVNVNLPLLYLGDWARDFTFILNATKLDLEGSNAADFRRFIEESGNIGLSFARGPLLLRATGNYRGRQKLSPQEGAQYGAGTGFFEYYRSRWNLDVNAEYQFSKSFGIFFNARNILNEPQILERTSDATPGYAQFYRHEEFGVQMALGVKGTF